MYGIVMSTQIFSIFALFAMTLYVLYQRYSRLQILLIILSISTMLNFTGYLFEITADCAEAASLGTIFAYIGKPFAMLSSFLFMAEYCGRKIPRKLVGVSAVLLGFFPVIVATNKYHHLYYSTVDFDRTRVLSPLVLGHGPLYFAFIAVTVLYLAGSLWLTIHEFCKGKNKEYRRDLLFFMGMSVSSMAGYLLFLTGATGGYDATMSGSFVGVILLMILFFRCRIFDALTLAKDQALKDSSGGLLVLDMRDNPVFTNTAIDELLSDGVTIAELKALPMGKSLMQRNAQVYEVIKSTVIDRGRSFGETIELTDITEKYNYSVRLEKDVENRTKEIKHIQRSILSSFAGIVEARDSSTGDHIRRMTGYVSMIALELRAEGKFPDILTDAYITRLVDVAPLHDIGKIAIPDSILQKPGRLTEDEYAVIKTHARKGADIIEECLRGVESEEYVLLAEEVAESHHEYWDGTGYPAGLRGEAIPLSARIVAVADVYDAVRSERCYKPPMSPQEAQTLIRQQCGTHFDPTVAEAFLDVIAKLDR